MDARGRGNRSQRHRPDSGLGSAICRLCGGVQRSRCRQRCGWQRPTVRGGSSTDSCVRSHVRGQRSARWCNGDMSMRVLSVSPPNTYLSTCRLKTSSMWARPPVRTACRVSQLLQLEAPRSKSEVWTLGEILNDFMKDLAISLSNWKRSTHEVHWMEPMNTCSRQERAWVDDGGLWRAVEDGRWWRVCACDCVWREG